MESSASGRQQNPVSHTHDPLVSMWSDIENGVREIHQSKPISRTRYIELYSKVYNYCMCRPQTFMLIDSESSTRGSSRRKQWPDGDAGNQAGSVYFVGKRLYEQLALLLTDILKEKADGLSSKTGLELLQLYNDQWKAFKTNSQSVNRVFSYLNRQGIHHEPGENRESSKGFLIYQLAVDLWKSTVFEMIKENLLKEILCEYEKDRLQVSSAHKNVLKQVIYSYIELGLTNAVHNPDSLHSESSEAFIIDSFTQLTLDPHFYQEELEQHLITVTSNYFSKLAKNYISCHQGAIAEYMKMVETEIALEEGRTRTYLPTLSFSKLLVVVDDALIRAHVEEIRNSFTVFLGKESLEDLARTYTLVYRLGDELPPLCHLFTEHIRTHGETVVLNLVEAYKNKDAMDPKLYTETLLRIHDGFKNLVIEVFNSNTAFQSALDIACAAFVNNNAVTQDALSSQKSAELIAKYADMILRKSGRTVDDKSLDGIIQIFQFLLDKDAFQTYYSVRLANRLISQNSAGDDAEQAMITKFKQHSGFEYTNKLSIMYKDIVISKDLHDEFNQFTTKKEVPVPFDFQPLILTSGSWPFKHVMNSDVSLPQEFESSINNFVEFYTNGKHQGRKLIWLHNRSKGELNCSCFKEPHILQLSLFQMAILLQYNTTAAQHRFEELRELTSMTPELCSNVLDTLTSSGILIKKNVNESDEVTNDTGVRLNVEYTNHRYRVTLPSTLAFEKRAEADKHEHTIKESRKFVLQCHILKIMKTRQTVTHKELELAVVNQTHNQFQPDSVAIRKCIENLIQREYMKRAEDGSDKYVYIA